MRKKRSGVAMTREKREGSVRESSHRGSRAVHDYDEKIAMPRHNSKVAGPPEGRDREIPLPKHRSMTIRPHERERDRDSISYYPGRSSRSIKLMSPEEAQKTIRTLFIQVKETISFFTGFKEEFHRQVRGIEEYAGDEILDALWCRKTVKKSEGKSRSSKGRSKDDGVGMQSEFNDVSFRLWESLNDALEGARSHPCDQNNIIAKKLENARSDVGALLRSVRNNCEQIDNLVKELKFIELVLELGDAGTAPHDDRTKQRHRTPTAGHRLPRDSSPGVEDARSERMGGGDSGNEDNGDHDEQYEEDMEHSGGREEREYGGDGQSQGLSSRDHFVYSTTNMQ